LIGRRRETAHTFEQPQILVIKFAKIVVGNRPNRTDRLPVDVERYEQSLVGKGRCHPQIWVSPFPMREEHWPVVIEHIAAWAEIAWRAPADVRSPRARNRSPIEFRRVFRQQTEAG
jgi:hypothetical protein